MTIKTYLYLALMISIFNASAQSGYSLEMNVKKEATETITINETAGKIAVFKNIDSENKITNTFQYKNIGVVYPIENYDLQNNLRLFSGFENDFEMAHRLTSKTNIKFNFNPIVHFEKNIDLSDISLLGGIEVVQSLNSKNAIRFGVKRTTLFGKLDILPTLSYSYTPTDKTFIEIGFPNSQISYSNNKRNTFVLKNSFEGSFYNLDSPKTIDQYNSATKISFSQISTTFEYERNVDSNWFMSFNGGYGFNRNYTLSDTKGNTKFDFHANNGFIFNIGLKYKH